jgi:hypothetical protein
MPPVGPAQPPTWTEAELVEARGVSEGAFKEARRAEGDMITESSAIIRPEVEVILNKTDNLLDLTGQLLRDDPGAWHVLRYVCGPPISEEDLWTLVGGSKFKRVPANLADSVAEVVNLVIDPVRFPWVLERRQPTSEERYGAVLATTSLMAVRTLATERRRGSSTRQEGAIAAVLLSQGFAHDPSRSKIAVLDQLERGTFSSERILGAAKCDVPVRLRDGRLLAVEAKVSNGPKNGWKRLNRETGGKAEAWRAHFGTQVITAVVLAGVFDLSAIVQAQAGGVTIFWEHDLGPLEDFVGEAD